MILKTVPQPERYGGGVGPSLGGCPVKVPVAGLHQPAVERLIPIRIVKVMQRGKRAAGGDCEDRTIAIGTTMRSCPVEETVGALDKAAYSYTPVSSVKVMQRGKRAAGGDCEDRTIVIGPAKRSYPVEVPVGALDDR